MFSDLLYERVKARNYKREAVPYREWFADKRYVEYPGIILGTHNATHAGRKLKFVEESMYPIPRTELAWAYLNHIVDESATRRKRVGWSKKTFGFLDYGPPTFFSGPQTGSLAYLDIDACYFSLYSLATLDLNFDVWPPLLVLGKVDFLERDYLLANKSVRNTLGGGIIRSSSMTTYSGRQKSIVEVQNYNRFLAPELWGFMMKILHSVAREVVDNFDVYYWNFDGCILPRKYAYLASEYMWDKWGLSSGIRGESETGKLRGFGSYSIGSASTKAKNSGGKAFDNILPYDAYLAEKYKMWRRWLIER